MDDSYEDDGDWEAWDRQIVEDIKRLGEAEFYRRLAGEDPDPKWGLEEKQE